MFYGYNLAKEKLYNYNQSHLIKLIDKSNDEVKRDLINQVNSIDWEKCLESLEYKTELLSEDSIKPIQYIDKKKIEDVELKKYISIGENALKQNKYAILILAGGQGTRLGYNGPKGTFKISLDKEQTFFSIYFEKILESEKRYNCKIPVYIMTSEENHKETIKYFQNNDYFGKKESTIFFSQERMPMFDKNKKVLIDEKKKIKLASNGHGNVFSAIKYNNIISDLKNRNIEWLLITGIDNILMKPIDELPLGMIIDKNISSLGKSIQKINPSEKMGVFCLKNNKPSVVEYTEISQELANMKDAEGKLLYCDAHLLWNIYRINDLEKLANKNVKYHIALKKAKYLNENDEVIEPDMPNAYKLESFIFDFFEELEDMQILRVERDEEYAPIKNANGIDSPQTAKEKYMKFHKLI